MLYLAISNDFSPLLTLSHHMSKSKKKKEGKSSDKDSKPKIRETKPEKQDSIDNEDPFDFGGLPKRDLKKNLGCG